MTEELYMRKYFTEYIKSLTALLKDDGADFTRLKSEMLVKIGFMQHERLIHLMVTILFAVLMFMCVGIFFISEVTAFLLCALLMLVLLVPYIAHYFFLENGVQRLYKIYDEVSLKADGQK